MQIRYMCASKMKRILEICALFLSIFFTIDCANINPIGTGPTVVTLTARYTVTAGKDALLTCVIMGTFTNDTVLWRRGNNEILAAGTNRVTNDRRYRVLHDEST